MIEADQNEAGERLTGTVVGLHQIQGETRQPTQFVIRLETGQEVRVGGTSRLIYRPGRRVEVQIYRSRLLGRRSYRFVRFLGAE